MILATVPFADPTRMAVGEREAIAVAMQDVVGTGPYIGGPFLERFETAFADYVGVPHCVGVDNGSNALVLALQSLDLPDGSVVLVPPNDGGFAAAAVQAAGLVPALADVDPTSMVLTSAALHEVWTDDVTAVVVTHLHGVACDMPPIVDLCRTRGVPLVEDCAQAHGARVAGRHVGSFGDVATFSFYPTKNLGALGDGGAVTTTRPDVADRVRLLRQYGWSPRLRIVDPRGRNCRLDPLQAAVLSTRLPGLDATNVARRAIVATYRRAAPALRIHGIDDTSYVAHHAIARTHDRDGLRSHLTDRGISSDVHYPYLVQEMPGIGLARPASTPNAVALQREIVSLPCFPTMTSDEIDAVASALSAWREA